MHRIFGMSFKITERNPSVTYYIVKNDFLGSIRRDLVYKWQPILYNNKEKFFQTYEISKEFDLNYSSQHLSRKVKYIQYDNLDDGI